MKVTKEQKELIRKLSNEGKTQVEIARIIGISQSSVQYWLNEESRLKKIEQVTNWWKKLSPEDRKRYNDRRKDYRREYYKRKYHSNQEYRKKRIDYSSRYKKKVKLLKNKNKHLKKDIT